MGDVDGGGAFKVPEVVEETDRESGGRGALLSGRWVSLFLPVFEVRISRPSGKVLFSSGPGLWSLTAFLGGLG
eukprot:14523112-Heterocapsa_arctica.AAC.1